MWWTTKLGFLANVIHDSYNFWKGKAFGFVGDDYKVSMDDDRSKFRAIYLGCDKMNYNRFPPKVQSQNQYLMIEVLYLVTNPDRDHHLLQFIFIMKSSLREAYPFSTYKPILHVQWWRSLVHWWKSVDPCMDNLLYDHSHHTFCDLELILKSHPEWIELDLGSSILFTWCYIIRV